MRIIRIGIVLGIVGATLIYSHSLALGFTIYVVVLIAGLFLAARLKEVQPARQSLILAGIVVFFAATFAVRSDLNLVVVNLYATVFAACLLIYFFTRETLAQQDLLQSMTKGAIVAIAVWLEPFPQLFEARRWFIARRTNW